VEFNLKRCVYAVLLAGADAMAGQRGPDISTRESETLSVDSASFVFVRRRIVYPE
jgi:hypothetical protein